MATGHTNKIRGLDQGKPKPDTPVTGKDGPLKQLSGEQNVLSNYSSQLEQSRAKAIKKLMETINNLMRRIE